MEECSSGMQTISQGHKFAIHWIRKPNHTLFIVSFQKYWILFVIFFYQRPPSVVAPNSVPIHQFTFECDGTETNLTDCLTEELPFILNFHLLDVFITCFTSK